uniref:NEDD8-activating enzyme E1 regulatory subunit n=1 Tax=Haptolina ericina TaxID=156174 RepID=A0A7S3ANC6_9EUKA|mmetsp:Transcript_27494/g.62212  ORF Transcript_27494/g.62212 Transcript_27494/m.62212 type:complete len:528 (+) Transcript_27494:83-1666(+)
MATEDVEMLAGSNDAKKKRYDRQLRLWGEHGQQAMEDCSICLINGSATGTETLKNLVLPGIGSFTVVDGAVVTVADTGNNFFIEESMIGTPRAQCVTQLLQELNEHVTGSYINEDIAQVLEARPGFLESFGLIVATQVAAGELKQIAGVCAAKSVPLIIVHTYGFMGYLRLSLHEHHVVEAHPDHPRSDMRVLAPPPALKQFIGERYQDLTALSSTEYAHVPYLVLLIKALGEWSAQNDGVLPKVYKQKKEVCEIVKSYRRLDIQADQNIEEAVTAANTALSLPQASSSAALVFSAARSRVTEIASELQMYASASGPDAASAKLAAKKPQLAFWLTAASVAAFVEAEGAGMLPLLGTLPDMTCSTETYVTLQNIYLQQAQADIAAVQAHMREIASIEGLPPDLVTVDYVKLFCKNSNDVQVFNFSSADDEYTSKSINVGALSASLSDDGSCGSLYLLLRAARAFRAERSRWPGEVDSEMDTDVPVLKQCVVEVAKELGINGGIAASATLPLCQPTVVQFAPRAPRDV